MGTTLKGRGYIRWYITFTRLQTRSCVVLRLPGIGPFRRGLGWHYFFALLARTAAMGIATSRKAIIIHIQRGILTIQGKGSVSFAVPFDGVTGVGPG